MAELAYMDGRKQYARPQAMLWADNPGGLFRQTNPLTGLQEDFFLPLGDEVNSETGNGDFLILSDDNRSPISIQPTRIETKRRMINGRMRSFHIADKNTISVSWDMLPSRSFSGNPQFDENGKPLPSLTQHTSDGGAGGVEMLEWYKNHQGSFWVYLAYDNYKNFSTNEYDNLGKYNQIIEVFFADFKYNVVKRGGSNFDFWNVELSLEEV